MKREERNRRGGIREPERPTEVTLRHGRGDDRRLVHERATIRRHRLYLHGDLGLEGLGLGPRLGPRLGLCLGDRRGRDSRERSELRVGRDLGPAFLLRVTELNQFITLIKRRLPR